MTNLEYILNNSGKLNDSLCNILDTLDTMDLPKLNYLEEEDSIDKILSKASTVSKNILDSGTIKNANDNLNTLLNDAGSYTMMLSIPVLAMAIATGGVGYIFVAPVLALGGFATKKYANRNSSILKSSGEAVSNSTKAVKGKLKLKLKNKREQKILQNDPIGIEEASKGKITTHQFASITINRIKREIKGINDKTAFICSKLKNEDFDCSKEELITLLQNDVLNSIVKIKVDMYNLNRIKESTTFYPDKLNAVIQQGKFAINAMCENMLITNEMMQERMQEIKSSGNNAID